MSPIARLALIAPVAGLLVTAGPADAKRKRYSDGRYYASEQQYRQCRHERMKASNRGTAIGAGVGGVGTAIAGGGLGGSLLGAGVGAVAGRVIGRETGPRCPR